MPYLGGTTFTGKAAAAVAVRRFLKTNTAGTGLRLEQSAAATDQVYAASVDPAAAANDYFTVQIGGFVEIEAGAALATEGVKLTSDANGRAVAAVATNQIAGYLHEGTAAAQGDVITVRLAEPDQVMA